MDKNKKNKIKKFSGFSFMEVILSIFILSVGIVGILPLFISNIKESTDSRDQIVASMLAQEGIELVQNFRDNNIVKNKEAFDANSFPDSSSENCRVKYTDSDIKSCGNLLDFRLYFDNNYYVQAGVATKFQRKIFVVYQKIDGSSVDRAGAEKAIITSMVIWGGGFPFSVSDCNAIHKCVYAQLTLAKWQ